jgi:hypothetical protein
VKYHTGFTARMGHKLNLTTHWIMKSRAITAATCKDFLQIGSRTIERKQQMTWAWLGKDGDEAFAIFDAKNRFKKLLLDGPKIKAFLASL